MKITKTLLLAGVTALSLGAGTAMAQESASGVADYWAGQGQTTVAPNMAAPNTNNGMQIRHSFSLHSSPVAASAGQTAAAVGAG